MCVWFARVPVSWTGNPTAAVLTHTHTHMQVVIRLESLLLMANAEEGVVLKLMRKDGKTTLKDGSITIAAKVSLALPSVDLRACTQL